MIWRKIKVGNGIGSMESVLPMGGACSFKNNDPGRFYHVTNYLKI